MPSLITDFKFKNDIFFELKYAKNCMQAKQVNFHYYASSYLNSKNLNNCMYIFVVKLHTEIGFANNFIEFVK